MKHFNEILATLGATDIVAAEDTADWSFWNATYRTPFSSVTGSYLYLKHKCTLREASPSTLSKCASLSRNLGYTVIVTPYSPLASNLSQTKSTFAASAISTTKQLLVDNFLKDFQPKPIQGQEYFIDPDLQLENGKAAHNTTKFLASWIRGEPGVKSVKSTSLAVLVADGGVGKTTVSRVLCQNLHAYTIPILVESDQWRDLLQATMTMDTVWDLAVSRRFEHAGRLLANRTALRVLIREGLFAVIFDGIDELCVAPGSRFQPRDVLADLLHMVTPEDELQQARMILTTRQTYWDSVADEIDTSKLEVFRLKGFDNEQRKRYFSARLPDQRERDLAFRLSKQISGGIYESIPKEDANENRPSGVPFILDLIAQYVHGNPDVEPNPYVVDPFRGLLEDVCKRENRRQTLGIVPSVQFDVFEELFREHPGTFGVEELKLYLECVAGVTDSSVVQRFTNHVFLGRIGPDTFGPKYEVLRVYFIARFLALGLAAVSGKTNRSAIARLLAANKTGKTQVIDWLTDQLKRLDDNTRLAALRHAVDIINDKVNRDIQKASGMALFHLVTKMLHPQGKVDRTQQLSRYLGAEAAGGTTRFHNTAISGTMKAFDLSRVEFVRCWFESVEFRNCIFSAQTAFLGCSFDGTLDFTSCERAAELIVRDSMSSPEAEYALNTLKQKGIRQETKNAFAEDALSRALRKFKGDFGFDSIQYRHRKSGFKAGNPYNDAVWDVLAHKGVIEWHRISNVDEGGLNVVDDKEVRREVAFFFDNGVLGRRLQSVVAELTK
ncbi:MAG: NACHT domain-containing protein [Gammaproteobacteria bacterium]